MAWIELLYHLSGDHLQISGVHLYNLFYRCYGQRGTRLVDQVLIHVSGFCYASTGSVYSFQLLAFGAL
jgi:hypothetical protein